MCDSPVPKISELCGEGRIYLKFNSHTKKSNELQRLYSAIDRTKWTCCKLHFLAWSNWNNFHILKETYKFFEYNVAKTIHRIKVQLSTQTYVQNFVEGSKLIFQSSKNFTTNVPKFLLKTMYIHANIVVVFKIAMDTKKLYYFSESIWRQMLSEK